MCFCWATNAISTHFLFGTLSWSNFGWPTSHDPHLKASPQNEAASAARMTFRHTESTLNSVRLSMYFWQASKCDPSFLSGVSGGPLVLLRVVAGRSWRWPVDFLFDPDFAAALALLLFLGSSASESILLPKLLEESDSSEDSPSSSSADSSAAAASNWARWMSACRRKNRHWPALNATENKKHSKRKTLKSLIWNLESTGWSNQRSTSQQTSNYTDPDLSNHWWLITSHKVYAICVS